MRRALIVIAAVILLLVATATFGQAGTDPITQGSFAVLLASHLNQPAPSGGWDSANAQSFLSGIGLAPVNGTWNAGAPLREGDMVHILRLMGLGYYSPDPDAIVTWGRANAVFARFSDFMARYNAVSRTPSGDTTTHVYTGIGATSSGAPQPASPSTP